MHQDNELDDPRRRWLIQALAAGCLAVSYAPFRAESSPLGGIPRKLPAGQSIYRLQGRVLVNGKPAEASSPIVPGDTVETDAGAEVVFVVGTDAYILRGASKLIVGSLRGESALSGLMQLLAGKVLAVFGQGKRDIETPTLTVGLRGTGVYIEADPERTYFCTCYGIVDLAARNDPLSRETIKSMHHDSPRYILANAQAGQLIRPAPFINHTDMELLMIETLVGRKPPFAFPRDDYSAPRRGY